ncbi:MAG: FeoA family protein [Planctomycetota bacterium]|nr:FeoA family protein [Planctomycetota bacterium]
MHSSNRTRDGRGHAPARTTTLDKLAPGQRAVVQHISGVGSLLYQRLLEMGVFEGVEVAVVCFAPLGDPMEVRVHGSHLCMRRAEARSVQVEVCA